MDLAGGDGAAGTSGTNTQTAFAVISGVAAILVGFVVLIFYFVRDKGMMKEIVEMQRRFEALKVGQAYAHRHRHAWTLCMPRCAVRNEQTVRLRGTDKQLRLSRERMAYHMGCAER